VANVSRVEQLRRGLRQATLLQRRRSVADLADERIGCQWGMLRMVSYAD